MFKNCPQENEVAISVREGRWPVACDPALRAHVAQCRQCSDFVVLAQSLREARRVAVGDAVLASPGQLWWKAQLRRRNRDLQRVSAPVSLAGVMAMTVSVLAALSLVFWQHAQIVAWIAEVTGARGGEGFGPDGILASTASWMPILLIVSMATLALFGMLVLYLALQRE